MKYYKLSTNDSSKIKFKQINGSLKYLRQLHYKNLLNEDVIKGCFEFPKRINNKKDFIIMNNGEYFIDNLISNKCYEQLNIITPNLLNKDNTIKIELNKSQVFYLLLPFYNEPLIEIKRFSYRLNKEEFNNNLYQFKKEYNQFPVIVDCMKLGGILVSEEFIDAYKLTNLNCFEFRICYDTDFPEMTYEELYKKENIN